MAEIIKTENSEDNFELFELLYELKVGRNNAVTGKTLSRLMDMPERKVRSLIEDARQQGHLIVNDQDGRGYYIADSLEDVQRQYNQMTNRAMSILKARSPFRYYLKQFGGKL